MAWLHMQLEIDRGLQYCAPCAQWGFNDYCGACGKRYRGRDATWRTCPNRSCRAEVTTDWCVVCGTRVSSDRLREFERGTVDVAAEEAHAANLLDRFRAMRPDLSPARSGSIGAALESYFGPRPPSE